MFPGSHRSHRCSVMFLINTNVISEACKGCRADAGDGDAAQIWGRLRVPHPHKAIDRQIAAIASCGVRLLDPFKGR